MTSRSSIPGCLAPAAEVTLDANGRASETGVTGPQLLRRAWDALAQFQQHTGQVFHAVLRLRADHPGDRSAQLAEHLSQQLGKPVSADWVRQTLHRAREEFGDLLLDEVAHSHSNSEPTKEWLEQELIDLGLLDYCRAALERRHGTPTR